MKQNRWYRILTVVRMALGIFLRIIWVQRRKKSPAEQDKLWKDIAVAFRERAYELEGLLIKVGQMLSVRSDLLPAAFIDEVNDLVDKVPPSSWEEIQPMLEAEWGTPYGERLSSIETVPIASASIGEVYKGVLKDGTPVAIKVQRPHIQEIIRADFQALAIVMWCVKTFAPSLKTFVNFTQLYDEIRQVVERELDFLLEMQTALDFKRQFASCDYVHIPTPFPEHCTRKILVMEWVETHPILNPPFEPDRKELARNLLRIFLPQWLEEGVFHADPHTGNVLVNREGQIVLLDYGMMGDISKRDSDAIQSLVEAIFLKNNTKIVQSLSKLGFLLPTADPKEMEKLLDQVLTIDFNDMKNMDMLAIKAQLNEMIRMLPIQVPTRFVFLGRSIVTVQGIIQSLCPEEDFVELAKPAFQEWLSHNNKSKWHYAYQWVSALPFIKAIQDIPELLQEPRKYREWKREEQQRHFQFTRYESAKKYAFMLGLVNGVFAYAGIILNRELLIQISLPLISVSVAWYVVSIWRQRKWMK